MTEGATYVIGETEKGEPFIYCSICNRASFSSGDITYLFCGGCHKYHEQMTPPICPHCDEPIRPSERANSPQPFHRECLLRGVIGSVVHLLEKCSCFVKGSYEGDPPGMSRRGAAKAAMELWQQKQNQKHN